METRVDIIRELCKKNGITIAALERKLGMGNGTIASSKSNYMRSDRLKAVADYFHVSMEYLMTGQETLPAAAPSYSQEERELVESYRKLNDNGKEMVNAVIKTALWQAEGKDPGLKEA